MKNADRKVQLSGWANCPIRLLDHGCITLKQAKAYARDLKWVIEKLERASK